MILVGMVLLVFGTDWKRLPSLPDREGFAGTFAGVAGGALLVAGGANFPDKKPWESGKKAWSDRVFVLERPDGKWQVAGSLPRQLAYGVSLPFRNGVMCVGGADGERHHAEVFHLAWRDGKLTCADLPPLPRPLAYACGAVVGKTLYVVGGQESPDAKSASTAAFAINFGVEKAKWKAIPACPGGGRMLATAAAFDGALWVVGGVSLAEVKGAVQRRYLKDAYRFDPDKGWKRIADLPSPLAAAPSPAPADEGGFLLLGGDDGSQVAVEPAKHRGFRKTILRYDAKSDRWAEAGEVPAPRVTVPTVLWKGAWVIPSGEMRPGVRSPEVWSR
jgi:N-acetylneuraminate epimerase